MSFDRTYTYLRVPNVRGLIRFEFGAAELVSSSPKRLFGDAALSSGRVLRELTYAEGASTEGSKVNLDRLILQAEVDSFTQLTENPQAWHAAQRAKLQALRPVGAAKWIGFIAAEAKDRYRRGDRRSETLGGITALRSVSLMAEFDVKEALHRSDGPKRPRSPRFHQRAIARAIIDVNAFQRIFAPHGVDGAPTGLSSPPAPIAPSSFGADLV